MPGTGYHHAAAACPRRTHAKPGWCAGVGVGVGVVGPRLLGLTSEEARIAAAVPKGEAVFGELARLLGDQPYFAGDSLSLADILLAPQLDFMRETPEWATLTAGRKTCRGGWTECSSARACTQPRGKT